MGYINPTWTGSIAAMRTAIAADDQALASAQQFNNKKDELAKQRNAIDPASLTALETLIPDSINNVGVILDLNALAAHTGVSITAADVTATSAQSNDPNMLQNPIGTVELTLTASGTYQALQAFLSGVEHSARLLDVEDIAVSGSDTGVYTYQIHLSLYWLR